MCDVLNVFDLQCTATDKARIQWWTTQTSDVFPDSDCVQNVTVWLLQKFCQSLVLTSSLHDIVFC